MGRAENLDELERRNREALAGGGQARIDKLEKRAHYAKQLYENNDEEKYNIEAGDIYSDLRTSWERTLEEVVFARVVQRQELGYFAVTDRV